MDTSKKFGPYEDALKVINNLYKNNNYEPVSESVTKQELKVTQGMCFSPGTTWENILTRMDSWKWISRIKPVNLEENVIIPLRKLREAA